jgi:hypothetical protein
MPAVLAAPVSTAAIARIVTFEARMIIAAQRLATA